MSTVEDRVAALEAALQQATAAPATPHYVTIKKDPKCPVFGIDKGLNAEDWLIDIKEIFLENVMTDSEKVSFIRSHMNNSVFSEIRCRLRGNDYKDPDKILEIFENIYCSVITVDELNVELYTRKQGKTESVQDYAKALLDLNQRIFRRDNDQTLNDGSLKAVFINGIFSESLREHLKTTVTTGQQTTMDDLRMRAIQYERDHSTVTSSTVDHAKKTIENKSQVVNNAAISAEEKILKKLEKIELEVNDLKKKQNSANQTGAPVNYNQGKNNNNFSAENYQQRRNNNFEGGQHAGSQKSAPKRCFHCHLPNHLARDCWWKNSAPQMYPGYNNNGYSAGFQPRPLMPRYARPSGGPRGSYAPRGVPSYSAPPMQFPYPPPTSPFPAPPSWNQADVDAVYTAPSYYPQTGYDSYQGGAKPKTSSANTNLNCSSKVISSGLTNDMLLSKVAGSLKTTNILLNNWKLGAMLDSGSQVSTMSLGSYKRFCPSYPLYKLTGIDIESASDDHVQHLGVIFINLNIFDKELNDVAIVIKKDPTTDHSTEMQSKYPVLIGTNILDEFPEFGDVKERQNFMQKIDGSEVKTCNKQNLILKPDETVHIPVKFTCYRATVSTKVCLESGINLAKNRNEIAPIVVPTVCDLKKRKNYVPVYNPNAVNVVVSSGQSIAKAYVVETVPPDPVSHIDNIEIDSEISIDEKNKLKKFID